MDPDTNTLGENLGFSAAQVCASCGRCHASGSGGSTTSEPTAPNLAPTVSPTATADLTAGSSSTDDSADPAVVAGAVVGVIAVLVLIAALVVVLRTNRQHDRDAGSSDIMKLNRTASHAMIRHSNQRSVSSADSVASPDRALDNMTYEAEAHCAEAVNSDDATAAQAFLNRTMERKMQVGTEGDLRLVSVRRTNPLGPDSPTAAPALADLPDITCEVPRQLSSISMSIAGSPEAKPIHRSLSVV